MTGPVRIQLQRTRGWRMPANTVKVDRSTKYGNPWAPGDPGVVHYGGPLKLPFAVTAAGCVDRYRRWVRGEFMGPNGELVSSHPIYEAVVAPPTPEWAADLAPLRGKNLACWCKPGAPCHGDVLLELANREPQR